jgi:hypothetical protein
MYNIDLRVMLSRKLRCMRKDCCDHAVATHRD